MLNTILHKILNAFQSGDELSLPDVKPFFDALIAETDELILSELLTAWDKKGIAENEIYSIAKIMRERMTRINSDHETFVDIVGTGGSRSKTFNVSTAAAFVVAGAGIPVAKHGNKAATSNSGSADVLLGLGIDPAVDPATAEHCLNEIGICFMFAPNFHRLSPELAKVRRSLGFPTIFNCVGPLCNPASAPHQLIGVWDSELVPKMANSLSRLGTTHSRVVNGSEGLDEISISGPTTDADVVSSVEISELNPNDFGIEPSDSANLRVSGCAESAILILDILSGKWANKAAIDLVVMNAAAAIDLTLEKGDLKRSTAAARESINSGAAIGKLRQLAEMTTK